MYCMSEALFSSSWYRVADLQPRLKRHATIHRQVYRDQVWYVLQDYSSERFHRFAHAAYYVITLMDGQRTVQTLWDLAAEHLSDEAPTQDQLIALLGQLHSADVLQCNVPPDTAELFRRHQKQQQRQWKSRLFSVLAWKFPLFDPERFLQRLLPAVRPFFGWVGALLWIAVVVPAVILAVTHWPDLTHHVTEQILTPHNLFLLWILFPILKSLHELGHGFAVKAFGGEVHEMGVMLLVFTPVPYVDASSAWGFREQWQRVVVGAAGMIVEVFLASLAFFVWLNVEPGLVRMLAYNTMLISGISTLLFNANPLLRFDGYYIFSDYLEIPNLRNRANAYLRYLGEYFVLGNKEATCPPAASGERRWFVAFGILAFLYRCVIVTAILLYLLDEFFLAGVLLGTFAIVAWAGIPLMKGASFLLTSPTIRRVRVRAILTICGILLFIGGFIGFTPMPSNTMAEGVIWIPEEAHVRSGSSGFVSRVIAIPGTQVKPGDILVASEDPGLTTQVAVLKARVRELQAEIREHWSEDHVKAAILQEELGYVRNELAQARQHLNDLTVRSQVHGTFIAPTAMDLPGRYVKRGDTLGYVLDFSTIIVRTVIPQTEFDLVRTHTLRVEARSSALLNEITSATISRVVPSASDQLPSPALGSDGGGPIAMNPMSGESNTAAEKLFQLDLELPSDARFVNAGGRVYVKFIHEWEPLATQWERDVRQLFLSRFKV